MDKVLLELYLPPEIVYRLILSKGDDEDERSNQEVYRESNGD